MHVCMHTSLWVQICDYMQVLMALFRTYCKSQEDRKDGGGQGGRQGGREGGREGGRGQGRGVRV